MSESTAAVETQKPSERIAELEAQLAQSQNRNESIAAERSAAVAHRIQAEQERDTLRTQLSASEQRAAEDRVELEALWTVVRAADAWRETLDLPQQDLGCPEFNEGFEAYDTARASLPKPALPTSEEEQAHRGPPPWEADVGEALRLVRELMNEGALAGYEHKLRAIVEALGGTP